LKVGNWTADVLTALFKLNKQAEARLIDPAKMFDTARQIWRAVSINFTRNK
jgi:hypothetical protein